MKQEANTAVFVAGYEKGRADGLAQAMALLQIAIDYYPSTMSQHARAIVPDKEANAICLAVEHFGQRVYRNGIRDEKKRTEAKREVSA